MKLCYIIPSQFQKIIVINIFLDWEEVHPYFSILLILILIENDNKEIPLVTIVSKTGLQVSLTQFQKKIKHTQNNIASDLPKD